MEVSRNRKIMDQLGIFHCHLELPEGSSDLLEREKQTSEWTDRFTDKVRRSWKVAAPVQRRYFLARNWNVRPQVWFFDTAKQGTQAISI